jgi:hypothetical protein
MKIETADSNRGSYERAYVEKAVSGAASCRHCGGKIKVSSLRVRYGSKFCHVRCWKGPEFSEVGENYFVYNVADLDEAQVTQLKNWVAKHNEKIAKKKKVAEPPKNLEKAISVSRVAAAPAVDNDEAEVTFGILTNDTVSYIFSFLSDSQLGKVERTCKSFLRAANNCWKWRYQQITPGNYDTAKYSCWKLAYIVGTCHGCSKDVSKSGTFLKSIGRSICQKCVNTNKNYTYTAKKYLKDYGLTEG